MSETDLSRSIRKALESFGCIVVRIHSGAVRVGQHWLHAADEGTPDLVCLTHGRSVWLEIKTATGKLSKAQVAWHERARKLGHVVAVVRSVREAMEVVK